MSPEDLPRFPASGPSSRTRRRAVGAFILGFVVALVVTGVVAGVVYVRSGSFRLIDEFECSDGEAPVLAGSSGGGGCRPIDAKLRKGERWDPLGNRPFDCADRPGWSQIQVKGDIGPGPECLNDGLHVPAGYELVDRAGTNGA